MFSGSSLIVPLFMISIVLTACFGPPPPRRGQPPPHQQEIDQQSTENQDQDIRLLPETASEQSLNQNSIAMVSCVDYVNSSTWDAHDVANNQVYRGSLSIQVNNDTCRFTSNAIPNHNFNDAQGFRNGVREQNQSFTVTTNPQKNANPTALSLRYDNAIMLNGVKVDVLAAGCFGVGDGRIGCNDMNTPWRYNPMSPLVNFGTDSHNAHTQPNGLYHYHGNPNALFDDTDASTPSPVIGFAADGFPIFGSYFDDNGTVRKAKSSYQLREGTRPTSNGSPGGTYDGTFIDDYEYVAGSGDLDACNGMTIDGVYGYYVTDDYPYILGCFSGAPHSSFRKGR